MIRHHHHHHHHLVRAATRVACCAPAATATITPGVQRCTAGARCTAHVVCSVAVGRSHLLGTVTWDVPVDSRSGFLSADGSEGGTVSTLGLAPPLSTSIGELAEELASTQAHGSITSLQVVNGTEPFSPGHRPGADWAAPHHGGGVVLPVRDPDR